MKSGDLRPAYSLCQRLHGVPSVENDMSIFHGIMKIVVGQGYLVPFDANSSALGKKMPVGHFQDSSTTSPFRSCGQLALGVKIFEQSVGKEAKITNNF